MIAKVFCRLPGALFPALVFVWSCGSCGDEPRASDATAVSATGLVHGLTPEQAAEPILRVGDRVITVGEFAEQLAEQALYVRARFTRPEERRAFLENLVKNELLAAEAEARGYHDLPELRRAANRALIQLLTKTEIEDRFPPESISDEAIASYYESHRADYNTPAQVRASHILIADRRTAQRVHGELLAAFDDLELFNRRALEHNEDPNTRDKLGDLGFFSRPGEDGANEAIVPAAVAEAAFSITELGGVHSELVQTERGFHIVKLRARRAARDQSLEDVRRPIRQLLWRERRLEAEETLIAEIRARVEVEENWNLLDQIRIDVPAGSSPTTAPLLPTPNPFIPPDTHDNLEPP